MPNKTMNFLSRKRGKDNHKDAGLSPKLPAVIVEKGFDPNSSASLFQASSDQSFHNGKPKQAVAAQQRASAPAPTQQQYPWTQRRLNGPMSPMPRHGHSTSTAPSKSGQIFIFGGMRGTTAKNDLWVIESDSYGVRQLQSVADLVSPRSGHASEIVGNAFIVFGGDTRYAGSKEKPDDSVYFMNISSYLWSKPSATGQKPCGRYGHTLSAIGSRVYIFGGQVDSQYFNDMFAFNLGSSNSGLKWEQLYSTSSMIPRPRSGHSTAVFDGKLYIHGGSDGHEYFNDTWCFDPSTREWTKLDCVGYIPHPSAGHKAAVVGEYMYIFGGRTTGGAELADLASLRLPARRWYMFQNMGPAPSSRTGHVMCTFGPRIVTLGGESANPANDANEAMIAYNLETMRIKYPQQSTEKPVERVLHKHNPWREDQARIAPRLRSADPNAGSGDHKYRGVPQSGYRQSAAGPRPHANHENRPVHDRHEPHKIARDDYDMHVRGRAGLPLAGAGSGGVRSQRSTPELRAQKSPTRALSPLHDIDGNEMSSKHQPASPKESQKMFAGQLLSSQSAVTQPRRQRPGLRSSKSADSLASVEAAESLFAAIQPLSGCEFKEAVHEGGGELAELERLRRANKWFETELMLARQAGFKPSRPVDFTHIELERAAVGVDTREQMFLQAILSLKTEIEQVRTQVHARDTEAVVRLGEVEKERDDVMRELALKEVEFEDGAKVAELERQLEAAKVEVAALQSEVAGLTRDTAETHEARGIEFDGLVADLEIAQTEGEGYKSKLGELELELEQVRAELERVQGVHDGEIEALKSEHDGELVRVRSEHEGELERVQSEHENALETIKSKHENELKTIKTDGHASAAEQVAKLQSANEQLQADNLAMGQTISGAESEIASLRKLVDEYELQYAGAVRDVRLALDQSDRQTRLLAKQVEFARGSQVSAETKLREATDEVVSLRSKLQAAETEVERLSAHNDALTSEVSAANTAVLSRLGEFLDRSAARVNEV
ncbi:hypothetical protein V1512DRAFT_221659 [Lipomyces arxii]|uniref:uncharacterized protein n=1 Tax=Lipomyces arxii TaxID=56418 RepID=UPI0034CD80F9